MAAGGDDGALVEAFMAGDSQAFAILFRRYQRPLFNAAYRITGNPQDALDATQNAFLKALDALDRFDRSRSFFSWIYRIAVNEALNSASRRRDVVEPDSVVLREERPTPEEQAQSREQGWQVHRALQLLAPDLRVAVVLRHFHELSYAEMSDVIGVPEKTVKSRLFSARRALRRLLVEEQPSHLDEGEPGRRASR